MNAKLFCFVTSIAFAAAVTNSYPRGCIYFMGQCLHECEEGTYSYSPVRDGDCGYETPEPTCEEPNPVQDDTMICDYSACYCDPGTYRNTENKCVRLEDCPKKN